MSAFNFIGVCAYTIRPSCNKNRYTCSLPCRYPTFRYFVLYTHELISCMNNSWFIPLNTKGGTQMVQVPKWYVTHILHSQHGHGNYCSRVSTLFHLQNSRTFKDFSKNNSRTFSEICFRPFLDKNNCVVNSFDIFIFNISDIQQFKDFQGLLRTRTNPVLTTFIIVWIKLILI